MGPHVTYWDHRYHIHKRVRRTRGHGTGAHDALVPKFSRHLFRNKRGGGGSSGEGLLGAEVWSPMRTARARVSGHCPPGKEDGGFVCTPRTPVRHSGKSVITRGTSGSCRSLEGRSVASTCLVARGGGGGENALDSQAGGVWARAPPASPDSGIIHRH